MSICKRPSGFLCAFSGGVASSSVCVHGTQQCAVDCLPWDVATSRAQIHQDSLGGHPLILFHLSGYPRGQHRCHFWLPTTSSEIFHSVERLVLFFFFLKYFLGLFIDRTAEDLDRKQDEREGEGHTVKGPRPGASNGNCTRSLYK